MNRRWIIKRLTETDECTKAGSDVNDNHAILEVGCGCCGTIGLQHIRYLAIYPHPFHV